MNSLSAIFKISWEQGLVYRLNFALWRVRTILQFLLVYFIWWTVFQSSSQVFGYSQSSILTYIVVLVLIRTIVFSSRATDVMNKINDGSIASFLLRPIGIIKFYFAQDIADKLLNIIFMVFEISAILFLLKPQIIIQTDLFALSLFSISLFLGIILWFCISMIISLMAFWVENSWGPLFLLMIFLEGMGGGIFPIDILPKAVYQFMMLTPFPYLIYFPAKLYLGDFGVGEIMFYFLIFFLWVVIGIFLTNWILKLGLKHYTSVGN